MVNQPQFSISNFFINQIKYINSTSFKILACARARVGLVFLVLYGHLSPFSHLFVLISSCKYFCCSQVLLTEKFGPLLNKLKSWHHHFLLTPRHCIYGVVVYEVSTSGMLSLTYFYIFFKLTESFCYSHFMNASLISLYTLSILKFKVS